MKRLKDQNFRFNPKFGAAGYKIRRRGPKHKSEKGNAKIKSTLGDLQPFALMSKGEEKQAKQGAEDMLPSMPKGETIGNVFIDGKGIGKGGASEIVTRKREKKSSREQR